MIILMKFSINSTRKGSYQPDMFTILLLRLFFYIGVSNISVSLLLYRILKLILIN